MVIVAGAGKGQQFFPIGNGHRADIQRLVQHQGDLHTVLFVKPLAQDPLRGGGHVQGRSGEGGGVLFEHRPFIQQDAHKERSPYSIGDHHRRGDTAHQM